MLDEVHITVNKNGIPFDTQSPFITSGIRLGTPAVTTRGMKEEDMREIAELINLTLTDFDNSKENIKERVGVLCKNIPYINFYIYYNPKKYQNFIWCFFGYF